MLSCPLYSPRPVLTDVHVHAPAGYGKMDRLPLTLPQLEGWTVRLVHCSCGGVWRAGIGALLACLEDRESDRHVERLHPTVYVSQGVSGPVQRRVAPWHTLYGIGAPGALEKSVCYPPSHGRAKAAILAPSSLGRTRPRSGGTMYVCMSKCCLSGHGGRLPQTCVS